MANVTIEIEAIDRTKTALGNIGNMVTGINSAIQIGTKVMQVANDVWKETVNVAQEYDQQIKGLMASTGGSADQTSRMVQVLDDAGIAFDTVKMAMKEMSKDGTEPSIEELATLSDQFLALGSGAERGQFLLDKFGKSGINMARAMELGGSAIRDMNADMKGGLILTEEAIQQSEEYRKNVDELSDSWRGFKVEVGNAVIPVLNDVISETRKYNEVLDRVIATHGDAGERINRYRANLEMVKIAEEEAAQAADYGTESYTAMAKAIEEKTISALEDVSQANKDVVNSVMEITAAYQESAAAGSAMSRQRLIDMTLEKIEMMDGVAGFSQAEQEKALAFAETAGVAEASAMREVIAIDGVSSAIANGTMKASDMKGVLQSLTNHTWTVQVAVQMQGLENLRSTLTANAVANPSRTYRVGGRAEGGSINAGTPYIVGERGPELIVPGSNGNVVPNNQMGGIDYNKMGRAFVQALEQVGR